MSRKMLNVALVVNIENQIWAAKALSALKRDENRSRLCITVVTSAQELAPVLHMLLNDGFLDRFCVLDTQVPRVAAANVALGLHPTSFFLWLPTQFIPKPDWLPQILRLWQGGESVSCMSGLAGDVLSENALVHAVNLKLPWRHRGGIMILSRALIETLGVFNDDYASYASALVDYEVRMRCARCVRYCFPLAALFRRIDTPSKSRLARHSSEHRGEDTVPPEKGEAPSLSDRELLRQNIFFYECRVRSCKVPPHVSVEVPPETTDSLCTVRQDRWDALHAVHRELYPLFFDERGVRTYTITEETLGRAKARFADLGEEADET